MENKDINYNKQYYEKNKKIINDKLTIKEECPHCKSKVRHQFMKKHQQSNKCKYILNDNDMKQDFNKIYNFYKQFQKEAKKENEDI